MLEKLAWSPQPQISMTFIIKKNKNNEKNPNKLNKFNKKMNNLYVSVEWYKYPHTLKLMPPIIHGRRNGIA